MALLVRISFLFERPVPVDAQRYVKSRLSSMHPDWAGIRELGEVWWGRRAG